MHIFSVAGDGWVGKHWNVCIAFFVPFYCPIPHHTHGIVLLSTPPQLFCGGHASLTANLCPCSSFPWFYLLAPSSVFILLYISTHCDVVFVCVTNLCPCASFLCLCGGCSFRGHTAGRYAGCSVVCRSLSFHIRLQYRTIVSRSNPKILCPHAGRELRQGLSQLALALLSSSSCNVRPVSGSVSGLCGTLHPSSITALLVRP